MALFLSVNSAHLGNFIYASIDAHRHEQLDRNLATTTLDTRRFDRDCDSDFDYPWDRYPFFLWWKNRPKLQFVQPILTENAITENKTEYQILLELKNRGKRPARNCVANFEVLSRLGRADLPSYRTLDWIYPDQRQTRERTGHLSYEEHASIELLRLIVNETKLSPEQTKYDYVLDGKEVDSFVSRQQPATVIQVPTASIRNRFKAIRDARRLRVQLQLMSVAKFKVSIYGDDGLKKVGQVTVVFGSKPVVHPILDL